MVLNCADSSKFKAVDYMYLLLFRKAKAVYLPCANLYSKEIKYKKKSVLVPPM